MDLDLNLLAEQLRILPTSPAWTQVRAALQRLELRKDVKGYDQQTEADARAVREYAKMLAEHEETLARALVFAKAYQKMAPNEGNIPISTGLEVLSTQLKLGKQSASYRDQTLKALTDPLLKLADTSEDALKLTANRVAFESLLQAIDRTPDIGLKSAENYRDAVLKQWLARFTEFFSRGRTTFDPITEDLLLVATPIGKLLPALDFDDMTLGAWTSILRASLADDTVESNPVKTQRLPGWFAIPALQQLGFADLARKYAWNDAFWNADNDATRKSIKLWSELIKEEERRGAIVLVRKVESGALSITEGWKPPRRYAGIWGIWSDLDDWKQLEQMLRKMLRIKFDSAKFDVAFLFTFGAILVELCGSNEAIAQEFPKLSLPPPLDNRSSSAAYIIPGFISYLSNENSRKILLAPKGLDEAVDSISSDQSGGQAGTAISSSSYPKR